MQICPRLQVFDIIEIILRATLSQHTNVVVPHLFKATELFMIMESREGQTQQLLHQAFYLLCKICS